MRTDPIGRLLRASNVGHAGIIRDITSLLDEFVGGSVISSVTGSGVVASAIENELDAQVDVIALSVSCNFNAVSKRR